jgi:hypothetical protein
MWKKERARLRSLLTKMDEQQTRMNRLVKEADSLLKTLRKKAAGRAAAGPKRTGRVKATDQSRGMPKAGKRR